MTIDRTIEYELVKAKSYVRSATRAERDSLPYFIQKDIAYRARQYGKQLEGLKREIKEKMYA